MKDVKLTKKQIKTAKMFLSNGKDGCWCFACTKCSLFTKEGTCLFYNEIGFIPDNMTDNHFKLFSCCVHNHEHDADSVCKQTTPPHDGTTRVLDCVIDDLKSRAEMGKEKYGHYLETNNGRNALQDAYEEALDLCMYMKQKLLEEQGK